MPKDSPYPNESPADFASRMAQQYGRLAQGGVQEIREGLPNVRQRGGHTLKGYGDLYKDGVGMYSDAFNKAQGLGQRGLQNLQETYGPENYMRNLKSGAQAVQESLPSGESLLEAMTGGMIPRKPSAKKKKRK